LCVNQRATSEKGKQKEHLDYCGKFHGFISFRSDISLWPNCSFNREVTSGRIPFHVYFVIPHPVNTEV